MKVGYGHSRAPMFIAAIYLVVSVLWIFFSDQVIAVLVDDPLRVTALQTYKGMGFVIITALLLYLLIRSQMKKLLKSQTHLAQVEEKLRLTFESLSEGVVVVDLGGKIQEVNEVILRMYGTASKEDLIGHQMHDFIVERYHARLKADVARTLAEGESGFIEYVMRRKDGNEFLGELSASVVKDALGKPVGIVAIIEDITERKKAEQTLYESEEKFRSFVEKSVDGIILIDELGCVIEWNKGEEQITGIPQSEALGRPIWEIQLLLAPEEVRTPDFLNIARERALRGLNEGSRLIRVLEEEIQRADGSRRTIQSVIFPVPGAKGTFLAGGIIRDITERKQKEERIRNLNEVLRALRGVNHLITREKNREHLIQKSCELMVGTRGFICAWILLFDEQKKYVSAAVADGEEMLAFRQQLEQGNHPPCIDRILAYKDSLALCSDIVESGLDCLPWSHHVEGKGLISRLEYEGKVYGVVSVYVASDYALDAEEQSLFRELANDITYALSNIEKEEERKREEQKLRESEKKYRSLFENMHNGLAYCQIIVDDNNQPVDFIYLEVNDAFERLTGLKKEAVLGRKATEAIPGTREEHPELFSIYGKVALTGEPADFEIYFQPLKIWLDISVYRPQRGYFVAIFENITERKQMEEQIIVTDRLASIGELASGIAHELNNPLTGIIGLSEIVLDADVPAEVKEDMKTINSEAQRTARIVHNLLTFARKQPLEKQPTNINDAITKVLELRAYEQKVSNINVITHFAPDLPEIIGNSFQLQQVFINIIINAEYFMTEAHGKGTLTISTKQVGDLVRISIVDDGPGVTKETLRHIFDPFFTTKKVGKGTGLGLSLCHGIVTEHGGRIYAESEVGKGATFIIEVPAASTESVGAEK